MTDFDPSLDCARLLDANDELAHFRKEFNIPEDRDGLRCLYFCGNSLGLQPKRAIELVQDVMDDWARLGVEGHFRASKPWLGYAGLATAGFAALTGAKTAEVVAMNTLTVNLHVLMASFYRPAGKRNKIVIESTAFPSDYFAVESQLKLQGLDPQDCLLEWRPRDDEVLHVDDLVELLRAHEGEVALFLLPGVQYYSGQVLDMERLCELAREAGANIGLDLAHAVGNVPLSLHEWAPDFAAWCTYKYLNGGPGSIAGAFVHSRHFDEKKAQHLQGWWGHEETTRFKMVNSFVAAKGVGRWQLSNPPILSLAPVLASLEIFAATSDEARMNKTRSQVQYLAYLLSQFSDKIKVITPENARGCQLSLIVTDARLNARAIFEELEAMNIIGDWREPNVIRVAPVPLYNSFEDIHEFISRLSAVLERHTAS